MTHSITARRLPWFALLLLAGCGGVAREDSDAAVDAEVAADAAGPVDAAPADAALVDASDGSACPPGQTPCGPRCVDLQRDPMSCGACDKACPAVANGTPACGKGACAIGTCNPNFDDCDHDVTNGCEAN